MSRVQSPRARADRAFARGGRGDQGSRSKIRDRLSRLASALEEPCFGGSPRGVHCGRRGEQRSAGRVRRGRISRADRPLPHCSRYALQRVWRRLGGGGRRARCGATAGPLIVCETTRLPLTNVFSVTGPGPPISALNVPVANSVPVGKLSPLCTISTRSTWVPVKPAAAVAVRVFDERSGIGKRGLPRAFAVTDEKLASEPEKLAEPVALVTVDPIWTPLSKTEIISVALADGIPTRPPAASAMTAAKPLLMKLPPYDILAGMTANAMPRHRSKSIQRLR